MVLAYGLLMHDGELTYSLMMVAMSLLSFPSCLLALVVVWGFAWFERFGSR